MSCGLLWRSQDFRQFHSLLFECCLLRPIPTLGPAECFQPSDAFVSLFSRYADFGDELPRRPRAARGAVVAVQATRSVHRLSPVPLGRERRWEAFAEFDYPHQEGMSAGDQFFGCGVHSPSREQGQSSMTIVNRQSSISIVNRQSSIANGIVADKREHPAVGRPRWHVDRALAAVDVGDHARRAAGYRHQSQVDPLIVPDGPTPAPLSGN